MVANTFVTLRRLHGGFLLEELADRFSISVATSSHISIASELGTTCRMHTFGKHAVSAGAPSRGEKVTDTSLNGDLQASVRLQREANTLH